MLCSRGQPAWKFLLISIAALATAADDDQSLVTCGSVVKLQHAATTHLLHSQEVSYQYGSGSGQQSVTGYNGGDDFGSYWMVTLPQEANCTQGSPIKHMTVVRLQHQATRRWLHSHKFQSPLTRNQEVSAFGDDSTTDTADYWVLDLEAGAGQHWLKDARFRLKHKDTSQYLIMHRHQYGRPISGHLEVCAVKSKNPDGWWRVGEGVYFKPREEL